MGRDPVDAASPADAREMAGFESGASEAVDETADAADFERELREFVAADTAAVTVDPAFKERLRKRLRALLRRRRASFPPGP